MIELNGSFMTQTNAPLIYTSIILHVSVSFMPFYGSSTPRFKTYCHCHCHPLHGTQYMSYRGKSH